MNIMTDHDLKSDDHVICKSISQYMGRLQEAPNYCPVIAQWLK